MTRRPPSFIKQTVGAFEDTLGIDPEVYHVGDNESVYYVRGQYTTTCLKSKLDVFRLEKPALVIDDHPEYIIDAIQADVPQKILVAKTHNYRWRKQNQVIIRSQNIRVVKHNWKSIFKEIEELLRE